jgi:type IV secretory pathway VirB3-like protein
MFIDRMMLALLLVLGFSYPAYCAGIPSMQSRALSAMASSMLFGAVVVLAVSSLVGLCYGKIFHLFTKNKKRNLAKSMLLGFSILEIVGGIFTPNIWLLFIGIIMLLLQHCACGSDPQELPQNDESGDAQC